jgi:hypothetical protein
MPDSCEGSRKVTVMSDSDYSRGYQDCIKGNTYGLNLLTNELEYRRGWDARKKIVEKLSDILKDYNVSNKINPMRTPTQNEVDDCLSSALDNGYNEVWDAPSIIADNLADMTAQFENVDPASLVPLIHDWQSRKKIADYLMELAEHVTPEDANDLPRFLRKLAERMARGELV